MNVLLAAAGDQPWSRAVLAEFETVARRDRVGEHALTSSPEEADLILFVDAHQHPGDWRQRALRDHAFVRAFPNKVFVYDERDVPRDLLPGVYVSMPRARFHGSRHRAFSYYRVFTYARENADRAPDLLFSFRGRRAGSVREQILTMSHPRAIIEDSSAHDFFAPEDLSSHPARERYRELLVRSKFVLCPRGAGTSSLRLFEALACGRVPVVLSDEWVSPAGVDWDACSVRLGEGDTPAVASRLEELEEAWPAMSAAAAEAYRDWFAPEVWFHRAVELCLELQRTGRLGPCRQYLDPAFWRDGARRTKAALARS